MLLLKVNIIRNTTCRNPLSSLKKTESIQSKPRIISTLQKLRRKIITNFKIGLYSTTVISIWQFNFWSAYNYDENPLVLEVPSFALIDRNLFSILVTVSALNLNKSITNIIDRDSRAVGAFFFLHVSFLSFITISKLHRH